MSTSRKAFERGWNNCRRSTKS